MKILIDSNPIFGDYLLQSTPFRTLEKYVSSSGDYEVVIPEVVIEETIRHFNDKYEKTLQSVSKITHLSSLIGMDLDPPIDTNEAIEIYRQKLNERFREFEIRILPIPQVDIVSILERDLKVRRPFDRAGKGFRDTLIWFSILEECSSHNEKIVIISADGDFEMNPKVREKPPELHSDLKEDLTRMGIDEGRVEIRRTVYEFNDEYIKFPEDRTYQYGDEIKGSFAEALDPWIMLDNYGDEAASAIHEHIIFILPMGNSFADSVSFLDWLGDVQLLHALDLGDDTVQAVVRTRITFDTDIYGPVDDMDRLMAFSKGRPIIIRNISWNDSSKAYVTYLRIALIADFIFIWDLKTQTARAFELLRFGLTEKEIDENPTFLWQ